MSVLDDPEKLPRAVVGKPLRSHRRKIKGKPLSEREYVIAKAQGGLSKTTRKPSMPKFSWDQES